MEVHAPPPLVTFCLAAAAGVVLVILAHRTRVPAIVLLLAGGIALGPEGAGWIQPESLGHGLESIVAVVVAVILFEGGLTLDREGYKRAPKVIKRLLTVGALTTWLVTAVAVHLVFEFPWGICLLMGSLVIVTGPTVISPLLRRMQIKARLHHVLYWEGVLIDIVGVFVALLCYEWLKHDPLHPWLGPLARFGLRLLLGLALGLTTGALLVAALRRRWVPDEHANILVFAGALFSFGLGHLILSESGILSVVVAGFYLALKKPPQLRRVRQFKLELTEFGIGLVFVLLAAKLDLARFGDPHLLWVLAAVMFVARPLAVLLATFNQGFSKRERLLLSWIAPRGIVAAAMASLFAIRLGQSGHAEAHYLETFTYAVIVTTVTLQGLTAPLLSRVLKLQRSGRRMWLLFGAGQFVGDLGRALQRAGVKTVQLDPAVGRPADLADPTLAEVESMLCVDPTHPAPPPPLEYREIIAADGQLFFTAWGTDPESRPTSSSHSLGVWQSVGDPESIAEGLATGSRVVDVVDLRDGFDIRRIGADTLFLFGVRDGRATIVPDPLDFDPKNAEFAVVLRPRIPGLSELVAHVELVQDETSFGEVTARLARLAERTNPDVALKEMLEEVDSRFPAAVGNQMAIPHAYLDTLEKSTCYMAVAPNGVTNIDSPDGSPVRLVCLLLSPKAEPERHLASLATLGSLALRADLIEQIISERAPARVRRLLDGQS